MNKWKILGIVALVFNPVPTGLLAGYFLSKERKLKKTGRIIMVLSVVWFALLLYISLKLKGSVV